MDEQNRIRYSPSIAEENEWFGWTLRTADDQFELVRREREAYLEAIRQSQSDPTTFLRNEINTDSLYEYLQWKFPDLPTDEFSGEVGLVRNMIDTPEYVSLADMDFDVNRADTALKNVLKALDKQSPWLDHAAGRLLVALALANESLRSNLVFSGELLEVIERNSVTN